MRLVVADDQDEFRCGLVALLATVSGVELIAEARDGAEAIAACVRGRPDVVLMDLRMPGTDGVAATREIRRRAPDVRVVVLTTFADDALVRDAIEAGASAYALKDTPIDDLVDVVRLVRRGFAAFSPGLTYARAIADRPPADAAVAARIAALTARERAVLREIAAGATNRDIATAFFLTEGTVKNYVSRIFAQLGVRSRTEAALGLEISCREPSISLCLAIASRLPQFNNISEPSNRRCVTADRYDRSATLFD